MWSVHVHRHPLQCSHCQRVRGSDCVGRDPSSRRRALICSRDALWWSGASWPTCLSHISILSERSHLFLYTTVASFFHSSVYLHTVLQTSGSSFQTLLIFTLPILLSSASYHRHPFYTSHLSIFALFLSLTSTSLSGSISLPSSPKITSTPLPCSQVCSLPTSTHSFRQHCLPHTCLSLPTFSPPILKLFRRIWSHYKKFCSFGEKSA